MRKRLKSLVGIIMSCVVCLQMLPMQAQAALTVSGETFLLTTADLTDEYLIEYGGMMQLDTGLTVDGNVEFGYGAGQYLIIPGTSTLNGTISGLSSSSTIQNSGSITSDVDLWGGTLENKGNVSRVVVSSGGMLKVFNGSSIGELDMTSAGSGMVITEGTSSVGTLQVNPYGFSALDSSSTEMYVSNAVSFTGNTALDDKFKIVVSDATTISTQGQTGLAVWKDGIKYSLPNFTMAEATLSDIYSVSINKNTLFFEEQAIGYQTTETATFEVTNNGAHYVDIELVSGGKWDSMLTVTSSTNVVEEYDGATYISVEPGDTGTFEVALNTGLDVGTHSGTLTLKCYTPDGDVFETFEIASDVIVANKPGIAVPSGTFYTYSGSEGKNGYYTSDVTVTPIDGYKIAKGLDDTFADSLTYSASTESPAVYLKKTATGQITEKATLTSIKIDGTDPVISGCESAKTYYKDSLTIMASDDNLSSVKLNSDALTIQNGKATSTLTAGDDTTKHTITAEDLAGNSKKITFYLAPSWRETGKVPSGKSIKLYKNTKYAFGNGTWTVDGDTTNYTGGNTFYVSNDGSYTFGTSN